jgi:hypothetical protein
VHSDSALVEGRLVGASAVQLGASLRLAAYVLHREAVKARRVRGGCAQRKAPSSKLLRALCEGVRLHGHTHPFPPHTPHTPLPPSPPLPDPDTGPSPLPWVQSPGRGAMALLIYKKRKNKEGGVALPSP